MKPKTKLQKRVTELSRKLPEISQKQFDWAEKNCFKPTGYLRKKSAWCLECGATFTLYDSALTKQPLFADCPNCGKHLKIEESNKRKYEHSEYYSIFTVSEEFQVLRHYVIKKDCRVGSPAIFTINEAVQNWIAQNGKYVNMSRQTTQSIYYDLWNWCTPIEVRGTSHVEYKYDIFNVIYPRRKYADILKRNGFKGNFHGISPLKLFVALLTSSKAETLIKTGQNSLLKWMIKENPDKFNQYWASIKICIRNNYIVKDASMWQDYIDLLGYFGKDTRNAKYICPVDLRHEHDRLSDKKATILAKELLEEKKKEARKLQKEFQKQKGRYFGISFSDGLLNVIVLDSIIEYINEGVSLNHCVFSNEYFNRKDSLILSARIDNKPIETIEISLKDYSILQCRGKNNHNTEYHDRIISLVNNNIGLILSRNNCKRMNNKLTAKAV